MAAKTEARTAREARKTRMQHFLAGTVAGVAGTFVGHPLDTIKVRLQTQGYNKHIYSGMIDCGRKIVHYEGVMGLFRGMLSPMANLTILNTISFGTYAFLKDWVRKNVADGGEMKYWHYALAGVGVGLGSIPISTPFELIKVRLQLDNVREQRLKGSWHATKDLVSQFGLRSLTCGMVVNGWREAIFCAFYFSIYEMTKQQVGYLVPGRDGHSPLAILLGGGFAGVAGWFSSFPLDVIKSIIQSQHFTVPYKQNLRIIDVAKARWAEKGLKGFYSGITPSLVRAFFVSGIRFSAYESTLVFLRRLDQPNF